MEHQQQPSGDSDSPSLSSRSVVSMQLDLGEGESNSPPAPEESKTPLKETNNNSRGSIINEGSDKGIVVDASKMENFDSSTVMVDNEDDYSSSLEALDDEEEITPFPKRKRKSPKFFVDDERVIGMTRRSSDGEGSAKRRRTPKPPKQPKQQRGVIIGVWKESSEADDENKHVVNAFIDNQDRLRTRIYGANRRGEELVGNLPTGAGSCWVTFPKVIFDTHLKSLTSAEIKEYVRIRSEQTEATPDERYASDLKAVGEAQTIVAALEDSPGPSKPIVHRPSLGRGQSTQRHYQPHESPNHTPGFRPINASPDGQVKPSPLKDGRINGVLLGYWLDSDEPRVEDKHAVYGVAGGSDSFRVKVQKVTRDGRFVHGNFPVGPGAMWIHYDKVVFEPQLENMTRQEIKEYVRIRSRDLEAGEGAEDRERNEANAIKAAKEVMSEGMNIIRPDVELRQSARGEQRIAARQPTEIDSAATTEKVRQERAEARERQNERIRREVSRAEAEIRESSVQAELKHNLKKLNKVWVAQQAAIPPPETVQPVATQQILQSMPQPQPQPMPVLYQNPTPVAPPAMEVKLYNGIRYERKQTGPFQGKLVSSAQLLIIDGEDYVEYRVLTQPSF